MDSPPAPQPPPRGSLWGPGSPCPPAPAQRRPRGGRLCCSPNITINAQARPRAGRGSGGLGGRGGCSGALRKPWIRSAGLSQRQPRRDSGRSPRLWEAGGGGRAGGGVEAEPLGAASWVHSDPHPPAGIQHEGRAGGRWVSPWLCRTHPYRRYYSDAPPSSPASDPAEWSSYPLAPHNATPQGEGCPQRATGTCPCVTPEDRPRRAGGGGDPREALPTHLSVGAIQEKEPWDPSAVATDLGVGGQEGAEQGQAGPVPCPLTHTRGCSGTWDVGRAQDVESEQSPRVFATKKEAPKHRRGLAERRAAHG